MFSQYYIFYIFLSAILDTKYVFGVQRPSLLHIQQYEAESETFLRQESWDKKKQLFTVFLGHIIDTANLS